VIGSIFKYDAAKSANCIWLGAVHFYGWYTFLAIGVAGVWAVAATFARTKPEGADKRRYPMVSFVVQAYDEENVLGCVTSLFKNAEKYGGLCEVIVVDDGNRGFTYEVAWSSLELNRKRLPQVRGKVVRHSANLGKVEAIRTGVNAALGGLVVIVDADSWWLPGTLVRLLDYMLLNEKSVCSVTED
jgi:cellulose synthase/poly-beta-1,6-N-acetylglucosamine synthase-like glycosyltransferase